MKNKKQIQKLCINAMLAALVVVFDLISIKMGQIKITFGGLPIIIAAIFYGPLSGMAVGLIGSFLGQLFSYGLGITTALWILPAGVRGLLLGLLFIMFKKSTKPQILTIEIILSSLVVSAINTAVIYLDSIIYAYPLEAFIANTIFRFISSVITAIIYTALVYVLIKVLKKYRNNV